MAYDKLFSALFLQATVVRPAACALAEHVTWDNSDRSSVLPRVSTMTLNYNRDHEQLLARLISLRA